MKKMRRITSSVQTVKARVCLTLRVELGEDALGNLDPIGDMVAEAVEEAGLGTVIGEVSVERA